MGADNFENLGFSVKIDGAEDAVSHLQEIENRLNNIKNLTKSKTGVKSVEKAKKTPSKKNLTEQEKREKIIAQEKEKQFRRQVRIEEGFLKEKEQLSEIEKYKQRVAKQTELVTNKEYEEFRAKEMLNQALKTQASSSAIVNNEKLRNATVQAQISQMQAENAIQSQLLASSEYKSALAINEKNKYLQQQITLEARLKAEKAALDNGEYKRIRRQQLENEQIKKNIDLRLRQELGIRSHTNSLASFITKTTSIIAIARRIGRILAASIKESAAYIENLNLFAVAFGESYEQQLDWALGIAEAYGLANNEVLKFAGTFRELSSSLGLVGDTADLVSETVTNLGYDLAALFNTTVEQAMEKLQSGVFSGNVRPLRSYGIDISQQQIDALIDSTEALSQFGINAKSLTQADKTIARLIITLQSGKDSFGTMAREINNLQSQFRIFEGSMANLKLAFGDLLEKPIRGAMVYINAFVIALTNVIRKFVPLTTEDETPKIINNVASSAAEASEELDELNGKLASFDKFNVMKDSETTSNSSITEELTKLLQEQTDLYNQELSTSMEEMNNEAVKLAESLEGIVAFSTAFFTVWAVKKIATVVGSIKILRASILGTATATTGLAKASMLFNLTLVAGVIYALAKAIELFKKGEKAAGALALIIGAGLAGTWALLNSEIIKTTLLKIINWFKSLAISLKNALIPSLKQTTLAVTSAQKAFALLSVTFAVASFANLLQQDISAAEKLTHTFIGLAAAISAAVIAKSAFSANWAQALSVAAIVAGGYYTIASMSAHADGGYSNANLIMTHENGKREWVGKAAGSSAIVNDTQMSDIMEVAVAKGVYNALSARSAMGGNAPTNETIVVKIGEEAVFNAVRKTARRQGRDFANV